MDKNDCDTKKLSGVGVAALSQAMDEIKELKDLCEQEGFISSVNFNEIADKISVVRIGNVLKVEFPSMLYYQ